MTERDATELREHVRRAAMDAARESGARNIGIAAVSFAVTLAVCLAVLAAIIIVR